MKLKAMISRSIFVPLMVLLLFISGCSQSPDAFLPPSVTATTAVDTITQQTMPNRIVLMLPLSGPHAEQGNAVKNGFLSAYYALKQQGIAPKIRLYDTNGQSIQQVYNKATSHGADFIVGPLLKSNVVALLQQGRLTTSVPLLTLNTLAANQSTKIDNVYQFALSPEDEAKQVAERMLRNQHQRTLIVAPKGQWGQSIVSQFLAIWQNNQGQIIDTLYYNANAKNLPSMQVARVLGVMASYQRSNRLKQLLAIPNLRFIPRRRQDFDSVFVLANNTKGRQIIPLLRFYYVNRLPIYATSTIYQVAQSTQLADLDGVIFNDMPWSIASDNSMPPMVARLRKQVASLWPSAYQQNSTLYGFGIDSYFLLAQLPKMAANPNYAVAGATGVLSLTAQQHIYRQLLWAQLRGGRIHLLSK